MKNESRESEAVEGMEEATGWKEPVETFADGKFEVFSPTLDSGALRKLGIPRGVNRVRIRIMNGVILVDPA
jgi:hypothetical protein